MVGDLKSIAAALERAAEPELKAGDEPATPEAAVPGGAAGLALQLTPEQWSALSAQWEQAGAAAGELTLAVGPQSVGSLRIACGWVAEYPWPFRSPGASPVS